MKITLSVIKADIGGWVGHSSTHPEVVNTIREFVDTKVAEGVLIDADVLTCGDDIALVMTHTHGVDAEVVHKLAWDAFEMGTQVAKKPTADSLKAIFSKSGSKVANRFSIITIKNCFKRFKPR